jgi:excisionase family DNA binding protein
MANDNKTSRKAEASKPEALLTVADVAVLDGCSEKTVRRAIIAGLLRIVRIGPGGRLIRVHPGDHADYRNGHR